MININNKDWNDLTLEDIKEFLNNNDNENFFFEYKADGVSNKKIIEEISAFANTYGGYIFIGIEDDKSISGCKTWNEQRIHTVIHDSLTPVPNFDVKKFSDINGEILVLRVDEGILPPYITNTGKIYERISSGSFPINDSSKLTQLYYKNREHLEKIKNKIYFEDIGYKNIPQNLCACLDLGFSLNVYDKLNVQNKVLSPNFEKIVEVLKASKNEYSISRVGYSLLISVGKAETNFNGKIYLMEPGLHNFIEIMADGSIKCRIILYSSNSEEVNISSLLLIQILFKKIYSIIMGEDFSQQFISAYKYEKLNVFKQFYPILSEGDSIDEYDIYFKKYFEEHKQKYGNNLIIAGNRIPKNDFTNIDKRYFSNFNIDFNSQNIFKELFYSGHSLLGYIDKFSKN